jgi:hypothetical protein
MDKDKQSFGLKGTEYALISKSVNSQQMFFPNLKTN